VTRFLLSPQHHVGALARSQDLQQHTEGPPGWPLLLLRGANPTRSQPRRQGCGAPCVIKCSRKSKNLQTAPTIPLELQKTSVLQGFASICLCLTVCTSGLMGNDTELKSLFTLFGIVFQLRVHRLPGRHVHLSYFSLQSTHAQKKIRIFQLLLHHQISLAIDICLPTSLW
jgi:hypothetical protein